MIMRNSVILIDQIQAEIDQGRDTWTAVFEAAVYRTHPVALTPASNVLAVTPLTHGIIVLSAWILQSFILPLPSACVIAVASWPLYRQFAGRTGAARRL
jgi:hypothetical protein